MMGMLKGVVGAFVEFDEKPAKPVEGKPAEQAKAAATPTTVDTASLDVAMLEMLQKKITSRPTPYTALLENSKLLEDIIADENTRIKAAFKTIAKDGARTVAQIGQAIDVHIQDIDGEHHRFKQSSEAQIQSAAGNLRNQAKTLEQTNATNATRVEQLQTEMANLQKQIAENTVKVGELSAQANAAEVDIKNVALKFEATVNAVKNDLLAKKNSLAAVLA